jgi:GLPGLI family protein
MKLYIYLFLFSLISYSQTKVKSGKIDYTMYLNFSQNIEYNATLFFDIENSIFKYKVKGTGQYENETNVNEVTSTMIDTITSEVVLNKTENQLFSNHKKKTNEKLLYIYEKIPILKWELLSDQKIINNLTCFLAKTYFRGRTYYAWYIPSIPVSFGPWKLNGLPGLIIEAYDETKQVMFYFKSLKIPFAINFDTIKNKLKNTEKISLKDFLNQENNINEKSIIQNIKSKMPRGIDVKVEIKKTGIELDYHDINTIQ